jgi:uncharacterized protein (TIGR02145 family)
MKIIAEYLVNFVIKTIAFLIIGFIANLFFELIGIPFNLLSNASSYNELYTKKPEIFDVEINKYKVVKVGSNEWTTSNLTVSKFQDGTPILQAKTNEEWLKFITDKIPAWSYYNYDYESGKEYGKIYNFYVVNNSKNIAPAGFEIPSRNDWYNLFKSLNITLDIDPINFPDLSYINGNYNAEALQSRDYGWGDYHLYGFIDGQFGTDKGSNESGLNMIPGGILYCNTLTNTIKFKYKNFVTGFWGKSQTSLWVGDDIPVYRGHDAALLTKTSIENGYYIRVTKK